MLISQVPALMEASFLPTGAIRSVEAHNTKVSFNMNLILKSVCHRFLSVHKLGSVTSKLVSHLIVIWVSHVV